MHTQRKTFTTWNKLNTFATNGLLDRVSLINRHFKSPLCVYNVNYPAPIFSLCELTNINLPKLHALSNLELLDTEKNKHDLIMFSPFLQWTQDVPGMLRQAYNTLNDDGFFIACFFGQDTLCELKEVCARVDLQYNQGLVQRFIPMIHAKDAAMLMQRAGFQDSTSDVDHLIQSTSSIENLISKLRDSGFSQHVTKTTTLLPRTFYYEANKHYNEKFQVSKSDLRITIDLIFVCGWKNINIVRIAC